MELFKARQLENTSMAPRRFPPPWSATTDNSPRLNREIQKPPTTNEVRSSAVGGNVPFNANFIL
jgi:hypothetical protein